MKRNYNYLAILLTISIFIVLFFYYRSSDNDTKMVSEDQYALKIIKKDNFWIYEIYHFDSLYIHQEYIPAVEGSQVFKTKKDAEKIGELVVSKLSKNIFPVITLNDLRDNKINFKNFKEVY